MKFRTEVKKEKWDIVLRPELPIGLVGSCFADNICRRMRDCLWEASNPLGVLFNPLSISRALETYLFSPDPTEAWKRSLFTDQGVVHSWLGDSSVSGENTGSSLEKFRERAATLHRVLDGGRTLFVTFGTAYCYFLTQKEGYVVANCHKQPSQMFNRRRVSADEIVEVWEETVRKLSAKYPGIRIIFTVSPVRHVRDGLHENTLSKAILHLAIDALCRKFDNCHYFPAFELLNDDLRDYRYYSSDLVHPSEMAVEYIWEYLKDNLLDERGREYVKEGEALVKRLRHRPILTSQNKIAAFQQETEKRLKDFCQRYSVNVGISGL